MTDEIKLTMELTAREAAIIRSIRDAGMYSDITVFKRDGKIERIAKNESQTVKVLIEGYGLGTLSNGQQKEPLDKDTGNAIVE